MKKLLFLFLLMPFFGWAQKNHTVGPKETLFSIGRMYNVHPRELAEYNKLDYGSGLSIGQVLKIPAKKTMTPLPAANTDEKPVAQVKPAEKKEIKNTQPATLVPVYHIVQKKESLYQISRLYNKVPIDNLKKWNKLTSDALSEGTQLIVGYTSSANQPANPTRDAPEIKTEKKIEPVVEKKPDPVVEEKKEPVVEKKAEPVVEKTMTPKTEKETEQVKPQVNIPRTVNFKGGIFKPVFDAQAKGKEQAQEEGAAGVFKSTSGWNDGKFYCLHNTAPVGTVIKVTNKATGKFIYAKVLDIIPDLKQNAGLLIRISNAASEELGAAETNFDCILNYSK